jgi:hypothetical protein
MRKMDRSIVPACEHGRRDIGDLHQMLP